MILHSIARGLTFMLLVTTFVGCAATAPRIRIDYDKSIDVSAYRTFGFPQETGTDRGGYSTLITSHFKAAVREQMQARGYTYAERNPQLLVNFFANIRERTEVRSWPTASYGYYGYRFGLYTAWPLYFTGDVDTVTYRIGTVNIDVVDAAKKQLVWEGIAEGQVKQADMKAPQAAISRVVAAIMQRYPNASNM